MGKFAKNETLCTICSWPGPGQVLFDFVRTTDPAAAVGVSRGLQPELVRWLDDGLTDLSLNHAPGARTRQTSHVLPSELLVLVSTDPAGPVRFDPGYVYIDYSEDFGRHHAEAYAAADVARLVGPCHRATRRLNATAESSRESRSVLCSSHAQNSQHHQAAPRRCA